MKKQSDQKQQKTRPSSGRSQQFGLDQQKKRKFLIRQTIYIVYYFGRIALAILILILINENFIIQLKQTDSYKRMKQNIGLWKQDVIVNITSVNSYNCPQGYQKYSAYNWPGTKQGCYCWARMGTWDYIKILQGACSQTAIAAGCVRVDPIRKIPFLFWKKNELICLKKIKDLNFFTDLDKQDIYSLPCAQNLNYQFMIPQNLSRIGGCPLTTIANHTLLNYKINEVNYSYAREQNYPLIMIKMTEYEFCPDFYKQNISPFLQRKRNYNLQKIVKQFCPGKDQRVITIDQQGEDTLFNNNIRIKDATSSLPAYPEPMSNYRYKLGFVRYPEWKYSCRKSQDFNLKITESHLNLQDMQSYSQICIGFSSIFCIFYGFLYTIFYLYRKITEYYYKNKQNLLYQNIKQIQRKKPNLYQKIHKTLISQLFIFGLKILLAISLIIILAFYQLKIIENFDWFKQSQSCTGILMIRWIEGYKQYFLEGQKIILLCIVLVVSLICVDVIMFCWRTFKEDLKPQRQESVANIFDEELQEKQFDHKTCDSISVDKKYFEKNNTQDILQTQQNFLDNNKNKKVKNPTTLTQPKRNFRKKRLMSAQMTDFTDELNF